MGPAYHIGEFTYKLAASASSDDTMVITLGYGFVTGIEFKLLSFAHVFMEWQYHDARSEAEINTEGNTYNDYHVDFSGHRILLGAMYYLL
jgi:hypothetical protein